MAYSGDLGGSGTSKGTVKSGGLAPVLGIPDARYVQGPWTEARGQSRELAAGGRQRQLALALQNARRTDAALGTGLSPAISWGPAGTDSARGSPCTLASRQFRALGARQRERNSFLA